MAAWKTIRITKPCALRIDNGNLIVDDGTERFKLSLEDTDSIVFEGDRFTISAKAIEMLSRHKVATLFCDAYYLPSAILHPYHQSSLATKTLKAQIACDVSYADSLWARIVEAKINLQLEVLEILDKPVGKIPRYLMQIVDGDRYGVEAKSAKVYWQYLFKGITREQNSLDLRNQALNYAYAIIRSLVTRDLSAAGFLPALGLWHDNSYNAFNLSDDLMEPLRPIMDLGVFGVVQKHADEEILTSQMKKEIIALIDLENVQYEKGLSSLRNASKLYIQQFKRSIHCKDATLLSFPKFDREKIGECI